MTLTPWIPNTSTHCNHILTHYGWMFLHLYLLLFISIFVFVYYLYFHFVVILCLYYHISFHCDLTYLTMFAFGIPFVLTNISSLDVMMFEWCNRTPQSPSSGKTSISFLHHNKAATLPLNSRSSSIPTSPRSRSTSGLSTSSNIGDIVGGLTNSQKPTSRGSTPPTPGEYNLLHILRSSLSIKSIVTKLLRLHQHPKVCCMFQHLLYFIIPFSKLTLRERSILYSCLWCVIQSLMNLWLIIRIIVQ